MSSMGFSMLNSKVHLRSSLQSIPDESPSPFDRIVHDQGLSTSAASGGLKPPPIRRLRWAYHHLLYSIATRAFLTHLGLPLPPPKPPSRPNWPTPSTVPATSRKRARRTQRAKPTPRTCARFRR